MLLSPQLASSLSFVVRCLSCGTPRIVRRTETRGLDRPVCLLCGYVGWIEDAPQLDTL